MEAVQNVNLTLNPEKCIFSKSEIKFWSMLFTSEGVKPDPEKVKALEHISPPKDKDELKSFIGMMQSNSDSIPNFAKKSGSFTDIIKWERFQLDTSKNI